MITFDIGKQFSKDPVGRFYNEGASNGKNNLECGEAFREEHLLPLLKKLKNDEKLNIVLDTEVESYGSSFLVEGFAGIVKHGYMPADVLLSKIVFEYLDSDFEFFEEKIRQYILAAKFNSEPYVSTKA